MTESTWASISQIPAELLPFKHRLNEIQSVWYRVVPTRWGGLQNASTRPGGKMGAWVKATADACSSMWRTRIVRDGDGVFIFAAMAMRVVWRGEDK